MRRLWPLLVLALGCGDEPLAAVGRTDASVERVDASMDAGTAADAGDEAIDGGAGMPDAGTAPRPRCTSTADRIRCERNTTELRVPSGVRREVHWQVPVGEPPADGWPVAIMFQGSLFSPQTYWEGLEGAPFGQVHLVRTFEALLEAGYAVLTPEAQLDGSTFWNTNVPPWSFSWERSPDHALMLELFAAIEGGTFGRLNASRMFALGISSGGYMTSRMAVSYPGRFTALAIHSASYATCSGAACLVPQLPSDHPPTIFLHGGRDLVVPQFTMEAYRDALDDQGTPVDAVVEADAGHEWIESAITAIPGWFDRY